MRATLEFIDMDREELNRARPHLIGGRRLSQGERDGGALTYLTDLVADQQTTIRDLRELMFPASTEKTEAVLKKAGIERTAKRADKASAQKPGAGEQKAPRHGRNGAEDYRNPWRVSVRHASLKHGDRCPGCLKGKAVRTLNVPLN